jgi:Domain of unknown function (DUF5069)
MKPLDLTKQPPRSPREKLGGLVFLARTIDKMRASLPGGNIGSYNIPGSSIRMLEAVGIKPDDLQAVVAQSASEQEVVAWVHAHSDQKKYEEVNRVMSARSIKDIEPERLARFAQMYPHHMEVASGLIVDILDHDDAKAFGRANR